MIVSYCQFVSQIRVLMWFKEAKRNSREVNHKLFMKEVLPDFPRTTYLPFQWAWLQSSVDLHNAIGDTHLNTVIGSEAKRNENESNSLIPSS